MLENIKSRNRSDGYREENIKLPAVITVIVLSLIAIPLVAWIFGINREGTLATDVSKYDALVEHVASDVELVEAMMLNDAEALATISNTRKTQSVALIVPEMMIIDDKDSGAKKTNSLNFDLEGIYWSADNPLVGIDGETYRVGDSVRGLEIVEIGKTAVHFKSSDGTVLKKDMYDSLRQSRK